VSIGMLIPFFELIFETGSGTGELLKSNPFGAWFTNLLVDFIKKDKVLALTAICVFIITATILKNVFIYLSNRLSVPIRTSIITELRGALYDKILRLPIGYFTEKRKG